MSDNPQTTTIDGRTHTYVTNTFQDEAEAMIAALVEKGVPGKLRPSRGNIICAPEIPGNTREARRKQERSYQSRHLRNLDGGRDRRGRPDIQSQRPTL
jgi:hypothetical protein